MAPNFNNPNVLLQSWYVVARSAELRRGQVLSREVGGHRLAVYRGWSGKVYAMLSRCAHLGADLAGGQVQDDCLRCPFHHWSYAGDGRCVRIPSQDAIPDSARTPSWTVLERHGAVWVWPGSAPAFPVPDFGEAFVPCPLRPHRLHCHPHLITCNGLDVEHFHTVHGLQFAERPRLDEPNPWQLRLQVRLRLPRRSPLRLLAGPEVNATFSTWAGNLATIHAEVGRFPLRVLFTHRPLPGGDSASQTFFFLPRPFGALLQGLAWWVMGPLMASDVSILQRLRFQPHLVEADAPLDRFMQKIERLPLYETEPHPDRA